MRFYTYRSQNAGGGVFERSRRCGAREKNGRFCFFFQKEALGSFLQKRTKKRPIYRVSGSARLIVPPGPVTATSSPTTAQPPSGCRMKSAAPLVPGSP